jgi:S-adenosylmethionine:tRNA ribosyltransferase-isomerase
MRMDDLNYDLPLELVAQRPLAQRDASRLLILNRFKPDFQDSHFSALPDLLRGDELIVFNNARVIPARLFGKRLGVHSQKPSSKTAVEHLTGTAEVFLTRKIAADTWEALVRPGKKLQVGERVLFGESDLEAEILSRGELGLRTLRFTAKNTLTVEDNLERLGHVPLPPYIDRPDETSDRQRYQTVFARQPGAVAAPTAGLHFTPEILAELKQRGCQLCELTLDVSLGTFQPIHSEILEEHKIHTEAYEIPEEVADNICVAKAESRPVLAIGTTVVRALEDAALRAAELGSGKPVIAGKAQASIFITPGYAFRIVDGLLTNFHLPRSTLLALVSAFAGREKILEAYRHAIQERYRFYSYGDCMLIR